MTSQQLYSAEDAILLVPEFDGKNMPYSKFLKLAEAAYKQVSSDESELLTALIRSTIIAVADSKLGYKFVCFIELEIELELLFSGLTCTEIFERLKQRELCRVNRQLYSPDLNKHQKFYPATLVLKLIPFFDGKSITYERFLKSAKRAFELLSLSQIKLICHLIHGKILVEKLSKRWSKIISSYNNAASLIHDLETELQEIICLAANF